MEWRGWGSVGADLIRESRRRFRLIADKVRSYGGRNTVPPGNL